MVRRRSSCFELGAGKRDESGENRPFLRVPYYRGRVALVCTRSLGREHACCAGYVYLIVQPVYRIIQLVFRRGRRVARSGGRSRHILLGQDETSLGTRDKGGRDAIHWQDVVATKRKADVVVFSLHAHNQTAKLISGAIAQGTRARWQLCLVDSVHSHDAYAMKDPIEGAGDVGHWALVKLVGLRAFSICTIVFRLIFVHCGRVRRLSTVSFFVQTGWPLWRQRDGAPRRKAS